VDEIEMPDNELVESMTEPITRFSGEYAFLSNFFPCKIESGGFTFLSVEAAFQAMKCADATEMGKFQNLTASKAKSLGRRVRLRTDWNEVRNAFMLDFLRIKFEISAMRVQLLQTGNRQLIEGNTWHDRYWGAELVQGEWIGHNTLGKLLEQVREEIRLEIKAEGWVELALKGGNLSERAKRTAERVADLLMEKPKQIMDLTEFSPVMFKVWDRYLSEWLE